MMLLVWFIALFDCIDGGAILALQGFQIILNYLYFSTTGLFTLVIVKQTVSMEMNSYTLNPNQWLEKYGEMMYQYILPRVGDSELAQDLVQDTFFSGLKGLAGYKGMATEKNWLFSILKNKIIDHYRKKSTQQDIMSMPDLRTLKDEWFNEDGHWAEDKLPQNWHVSDSQTERKEIQKIIKWCTDHLKTVQRHVFTLKYLEDIDSSEICKVLNITSSNYWILIHRARLQMRECVEKHWLKS
ncbi:MAG: sigma-70 family RNA polymerase sigma factor [Sediminibacterium sp.]|nr:sigma-70 family RNA polymerase sigma factor [Sediminibacterium sp.]